TLRIRAADAVLQWPADRRPQLESGDPGIEAGELAVERLLQPAADDLTLLDALGDDDGFGKEVVGELNVQWQIEPDRTLPDVEAVPFDVRVVLQQPLEPFDLVLGGVNRGILGKGQIDDQLRPVRGGEELLLDKPVAVKREN